MLTWAICLIYIIRKYLFEPPSHFISEYIEIKQTMKKALAIILWVKLIFVAAIILLYVHNSYRFSEPFRQLFLYDILIKFFPFFILGLLEVVSRKKGKTLLIFIMLNIIPLFLIYLRVKYINFPVIFFDIIILVMLTVIIRKDNQ